MRALLACLLVSCVSPGSDGPLDVTAITPVSGPSDKTQDVRIDGLGFEPRLVSNLDDGSTTYDGTLDVTIGSAALSNAVRIDASTITGTVPANLAPGTYDVTVTLGPATDTLAGAYTVEQQTTVPPPPLPTQIEIDPFTLAAPVRYASDASFTHTVGSGAGRAILVGLSISFAGTTASEVRCNGALMTRLVAQDAPANDGRVELWGLAAPAPGPALIEIALVNGTSSTLVAGAASFANVDQAQPFGSPVASSSTSGNPTLDISASSGDVVFGVVMFNGGHYTNLLPVQPAAWNIRIDEMSDGPSIVGAASISVADTQFVWNVESGPQPPVDFWAAAGVLLKEGL